jgi:hypothetical protein
VALRPEAEAALARFKLVEPVTLEDMATIQKHLKFALGVGASVEVKRDMMTGPVLVQVWRDGATARLSVTCFASPEDARAHDTANQHS